MDQWLDYLKKRFFPFSTFLTIIGYALTPLILNRQPFAPFPFVVSCLLLFYLAFLLRLDNDVKDFNTDCIAFPQRPLPRGDIQKGEAQQTLAYLKYGVIFYFVAIFLFFSQTTRLLLIVTGCYLWLILRDFFGAKWMTRYLLVKGMLQQGFIIPLTLLIVSIGRPELVFSSQGWSYALLLFGAFSTFEICRKLDPYSHPAALYYVHYYGFTVTYWVAVLSLVISAIGAWGLGVPLILWPFEAGVFLFLTLLFLNPTYSGKVKIAAAVSLIVHAWAGIGQDAAALVWRSPF
ncbi:MAG: hypothetical protein WB791_10650 [Waddliaceae bacterium]